MKPGLGFKIMLFTFLLLIVTAGVLIYFSYRASYEDLEKAIGQRLEAIAATGALMIDGDLHDQISAKSPEDFQNEAFLKLQKVLRDIKKINGLKEEIYTFRREEGKVRFVVMSHQKPFIDTYAIRQEMWPALNDGKTSHTKIFTDEHGMWLSAYAPIKDSQGHISGILDVDIELSEFQAELRSKVNRLAVISAIIMGVAILLSFLLSRGLVRKLRYLNDITVKISTGMMDRTIEIKSKDEVGELAQSLERMRVSLKMAMDMIAENEQEEEE